MLARSSPVGQLTYLDLVGLIVALHAAADVCLQLRLPIRVRTTALWRRDQESGGCSGSGALVRGFQMQSSGAACGRLGVPLLIATNQCQVAAA